MDIVQNYYLEYSILTSFKRIKRNKYGNDSQIIIIIIIIIIAIIIIIMIVIIIIIMTVIITLL